MRVFLLTVKKFLDVVVNILQVSMFSIVFAVVMAQIFCRYILASPLPWSEELSRFLFIWISLMGWSQATRSGHNIRITFIEERLPRLPRAILNIVFKAATLAFLGLLVYLGADMARRTFNRPSVSIPWFTAGMVYLALPVGALCCMYYTLLDMLFPGRSEQPAIMD